MARLSAEYIEHETRGPFPGRIDPWAEDARYFHQMHGSIIHELQWQLQQELHPQGYLVGKEATIQVLGGRRPDVMVEGGDPAIPPPTRTAYDNLATALAVEAGAVVLVADDIELDAIHIIAADTGQLVTVIEIISPGNKTHPDKMARYLEQRGQLFVDRGVNVVEIDATRSYKRLVDHPLLVEHSAYHTAIHLPDEGVRAVTSNFEEALKPFALPLRGNDGVRVEPHAAYERAHHAGPIAGFIQKERRYAADWLPYPSMLTEGQREAALATVKAWQDELEKLAQPTP